MLVNIIQKGNTIKNVYLNDKEKALLQMNIYKVRDEDSWVNYSLEEEWIPNPKEGKYEIKKVNQVSIILKNGEMENVFINRLGTAQFYYGELVRNNDNEYVQYGLENFIVEYEGDI